MAQVRKFDKGTNKDGITVQPELFEWEGVGSYERKPMVQTLTKNLAGYADYLHLTGDRRNRFMTNGAAAIRALESGKLRRLADGSYEDTSDLGMASTGKYDKNWLGKIKDTDNNAYNDISRYLDAYLDKASVYDPEKVKKEAAKDKVKFGGDAFLKQQLAKSLYAGNFSEDDWFNHRTAEQRNKAIADVFNNADYADIYGKYLWDDTGIDSAETLRQRGIAFANEIGNNTSNNLDYNTASALGITQLKSFLEKAKAEEQQPAETPESRKKAAIQALVDQGYSPEQAAEYYNLELAKEQRGREDQLQGMRDEEAQALADRAFATWFTENSGRNRGINTGWTNQTSKYYAHNDETLLDLVNSTYGGKLRDFYSDNVSKALLGQRHYAQGVNMSEQVLRSLRHAWNSDRNWFQRTYKDGEYIIPGTTMDYTAYVYNPSRNAYRKVDLLTDQAYQNYVRQIWDAQQKAASHKEGGILKFKDGGFYFDDTANDTADDWVVRYNKAKTEKKEAVKKEASKSNRNPEQYEAGQKQIGTDFTTLEKVRLGTAAADVLSAISAFIPGYGTATSAVTGIGSTLTNFGVDMADKSVSQGQMWGNLGLGLGMDVIGLIPGLGAGAKAGKIAKVFANIAPKAMLAWGAIEGGGPAIQAAQKLMSDSNSMTVDDWRALSGGLQLLVGGVRYGAGKRQLNKYVNKEKVSTVRTKSGKDVEISKEKLAQMKKASGLEEQNKILESVAPGEKLSKEFKSKFGVQYSGPATGSLTRRSFVKNTNPTMSRDESWFRGLAGFGEKTSINARAPKWARGWTETKNPNAPRTSRAATSSPQKPKRRIQSLDVDGETRMVDRQQHEWVWDLDSEVYRTVPGKIQNTKRIGKLTDAEIKQINNNRRAAGQQPLTQQEIARINARAENNNYQAPSLRERVMASERYQKKSLEQDLARARQEMADATAASVARSNPLQVFQSSVIPSPSRRLGMLNPRPTPRRIQNNIPNPSEPAQSIQFKVPNQVRETLLLPYRSHNSTLPAVIPTRIQTTELPSINTLVGKQFRTTPLRENVAQARAKAKSNRSETAKKAAQTRAKNKAQKEADKPKRQAEFNERQKQREEQKYNTKRGREQAVKRFFNSPEGLAQQQRAQKIIDERNVQRNIDATVKRAQNRIKAEASKGSKAKKKVDNKSKKAQTVLEKRLLEAQGLLRNGGTLIPKFQNPATGINRTYKTGSAWTDLSKLQERRAELEGKLDIQGMYDNWLKTAGKGKVSAQAWADYLNAYNDSYNSIRDDNPYIDSGNGVKSHQELTYSAFPSLAAEVSNLATGQNLTAQPTGLQQNVDNSYGVRTNQYHFIDPSQELLKSFEGTGVTYKDGRYVPIKTLDATLNTRAAGPDTDPNFKANKSTGKSTFDAINKFRQNLKSTTARAGNGKTKSSSGSNWSLMPEDVLSIGRALGDLGANVAMANKQKEGMKPVTVQVPHRQHAVVNDYLAEKAGEDTGTRYRDFGSRAITPNAESYFAQQLEAENKAAQAVNQGKYQSANRFYQTWGQDQEDRNWNNAMAIQGANQNQSAFRQIDMAKHSIDSALIGHQQSNVIDPLLAGIENNYRQNKAIQRQANATAFQRATLAKYQDAYDTALAAGDTAGARKAMDNYQKDIEDYNSTIYSSPWLIQKTRTTPTTSSYNWVGLAKEGGRLTAREKEVIQRARDFNKRMLADNKQFHKDIMESKKEHNKLIAGMSSLTADLIKNGMKWK